MLKHLFVGTVILGIFALSGAPAKATVVTYDVNTAFSGPLSGGTAPFIRLEFDDAVVPGFVRMTASAPGLSPTEWVAKLDLNMDPAFDASQLTFSNFQIHQGTLLQPIAFLGNNQLEADGGGFFDWELQFAVSGGGFTRRWNQGETFSFDLSGIDGMNASSFNFLSAPPAANGQQVVAVLIQGIGEFADEGWHTVPEPGAGLLALLALGAQTLRRR